MVWTDVVTSDSIPPKIFENLATVQRQELHALLDEFSEVLDDIPGQTDIAIYHINTDHSPPIPQAPYIILHAHKETVKMELVLMLSNRKLLSQKKVSGHHLWS